MEQLVLTQQQYHTQDQIGMLMNQLTIDYAGKARVYPIGETSGRSSLRVIELSDNLESAHLKPAIKVRISFVSYFKKVHMYHFHVTDHWRRSW